MTLRLDWCSYTAAKWAVEHWHYSRRMPTGKSVTVGVWESGRFVGCLIFGWGANRNIGAPFGLPQAEVAECVRIALAGHDVPVSRCLAIAVRMLRRHSPGVRLLVSYADANEGHHGGIYQAANWIYVGRTDSRPKYVAPDGRALHGREVSTTGVNPAFGHRRCVVKIGSCIQMEQQPKYKYLLPLDIEMRAQIAPLAKPYPKRAVSIVADAPAIHAGEGGSIPTTALHTP